MARSTRKRLGAPGFVYFIQAGADGPIKIGYTADPFARLEELQTAHYEDLRLLMTIADNGTLEARLHERFAELRIRGEWFRAEGELDSVLWMSGLVPHPQTVEALLTQQVVEAIRNRPPWDAEIGAG
jgi:hypothetical protein